MAGAGNDGTTDWSFGMACQWLEQKDVPAPGSLLQERFPADCFARRYSETELQPLVDEHEAQKKAGEAREALWRAEGRAKYKRAQRQQQAAKRRQSLPPPSKPKRGPRSLVLQDAAHATAWNKAVKLRAKHPAWTEVDVCTKAASGNEELREYLLRTRRRARAKKH